MKRKSPISVERVQLYTYEGYEDAEVTYFIDQFPYDDRRDFAVDEYLAGIAVRLEICNKRKARGARRHVTVTITDITMRCETTSHTVKVNLRKEDFLKRIHLDFNAETAGLIPGHHYKITVSDATSGIELTQTVFHLFDTAALGEPDRWYEIVSGGIKPEWESNSYRSLNTVDGHDYYIRFTLVPRMNPTGSTVLPELEMRLYYPDGKQVSSQFSEPRYFGFEDYQDGILTVSFPFMTLNDTNGIFYAELLCMEYPVAGFVFDTTRDPVLGVWFDEDVEPLEEYTPEAATERLNILMPMNPNKDDPWSDDVFDQMLQDFIDSQMEETEE